MEDLPNLPKTKFNFMLNSFGINKDNLIHYEYEYNNNKGPLSELLDKIIDNEKDILDLKIHDIINDNLYQVNLHKNCINEISLFVDEDNDNNNQLFNIDILIQTELDCHPSIEIKYKKESYKYITQFNDLNICKISLLDVDLKYLEIYLNQIDSNDMNFEHFKLLGNKKLNSKTKINFKINYEKLKSKNLLFCLNYFYTQRYVLTIHENEKIKPNTIKVKRVINKNDLDILDKNIAKKINILLDKIEADNCNFNDFRKLLKEELELDEYNYKNPSLEENDYFIMLDYFKKYIIYTTYKTIDKIIEHFFIYYEQPSLNELNILKKNIKYILLKYDQFNEYINYIEGKKSKAINIKINNDNLSNKEKIDILSTLLTILFSSPIFELNTKIEFMVIEKEKRSIYYKSVQFLKKIIDKLNKESYYIRGFRQTFSQIKKDINEINEYSDNKNLVFSIEDRDLNDLKILMKNYLPTQIVRFLNTSSSLNSIYDIFSKNIIINEIIYIDRERYNFVQNNNKIYDSINSIIIGDIDLNIKNNLYLFNLYTYKSFWRIIHEGFGHKPVSILNNNEYDTPSKFIINGTFHEITDAGKLLEYYINDTREKFEYLLYKNYDTKKLLNENLYCDINFAKFWTVFGKIPKSEEKVIKKQNIEKEVYKFIIDIFEEIKNPELKAERYKEPIFLYQALRRRCSLYKE